MMNKETALSKGYHTTGIYSSSADEIRPRLDAIRAKGYKALLVTVPTSPLSRGNHAPGYAVVVEIRFLRDEQAASVRAALAAHPGQVQALQHALTLEIAKLEVRAAENKAWLTANGYSV